MKQKFDLIQALHLVKEGYDVHNPKNGRTGLTLERVLCDAPLEDWEFTDKVDPDYTLNGMSDENHTFGQLYEQRLVLSILVFNTYKDKAWKSYKHFGGELCFGGGWFVVGVTTPEGQYTYHYKNKEWDKFYVPILEEAPKWDGHTASDIERLLSLMP